MRFVEIDLRLDGLVAVQDVRDLGDVARSQHETDVGGLFDDLFAEVRCGAAADADLGVGLLFLVERTEFGEEFVHGLFADRTGVDENEVGIFRPVGQFVMLFFRQFGDHMLAVAYVHGAAERFDKQFFHIKGNFNDPQRVLEDMHFVHVFVVCEAETDFAHVDAFAFVLEVFLQCKEVFVRIFTVEIEDDGPLFLHHVLDLVDLNLFGFFIRVAASDFELHTFPSSRFLYQRYLLARL